MNTSPRIACARADSSRGSRPAAGCAASRWIRIAALSDRALPSDSASVGLWPIGLLLSRSRKASLVSHDAVSTMRYGAPAIVSAASIVADPEPFLPYSVYMRPPFFQARIGDRARDVITDRI